MNGEMFDVCNLVIGGLFGIVLVMGVVEICYVIDVVNVVWLVWCKKIVKECVVILCKWYDLMMENVDDFVLILMIE